MFKTFIKLKVLEKLSKESLSGYDLMDSIGDSNGKKPSPGYIYPLLNDLEERNFITVKLEGRKKIYHATAKGKKLFKDLQKQKENMMNKMAPIWKMIGGADEMKKFAEERKRFTEDDKFKEDREIFQSLHGTIFKAWRNSNDQKRKKMRKILSDTIKKLEGLK